MTQPNQETGTPAHKVFNILAVDGGGFKGLYSAALLNVLETAYGPLTDHVDLLCGTSTGALIVLPLSLGKSTNDVIAFYKGWGPKIFPDPGKFGAVSRKIRLLLHKSQYNDVALKQAAAAVLGENRLKDALVPVCIPSFDTAATRPRVFKTDHASELTRDRDLFMWQVAVATAAAPTFFPIATVDEGVRRGFYADGGIWANNPALIGLVEACRFFVGPGKEFHSVRILSIANVAPVSGRLATNEYPKNPLEYGGLLYTWMSEGQRQSLDYIVQFLIPAFRFPVEYIRVQPRALSDKMAEGVRLDVATQTAIETLINLGSLTGFDWKPRPEIKRFFERTPS